MTSKAFGEETPTQGEDAVSWQTWSDGGGGTPYIEGDADWGKLSLDITGEEGRSAVYDLGSSVLRNFILTENYYGTGSGTTVLEIRGSATSFNQDDVNPAWEEYSASIERTWRYVQVRETTVTGNRLYISTTGDDTTGDGSSGNPWKTFTKAMSMAVAGDTIYAEDGVYPEDTGGAGYWSISKNVADWITIQPTNGAAGDVTVRATSGTIQNTLIAGTTSHLRFKWIKFGVLTGTRYCFRINTTTSYVAFENCTFIHDTNYENFYHAASASVTDITFIGCTFTAVGTQASIVLSPGGGNPCTFTFVDCTFTASQHMCLRVLAPATVTLVNCALSVTGGTQVCVYFTGGSTLVMTGGSITSAGGSGIRSDNASNVITLINVTVTQTSANDAVSLNGGTVTLSGCIVYQSANAKCICFGVDAASGGNATTVSVTGGVAIKTSGTNHAVMVGNGATGTIDGIVIPEPSGDYGMVVKENTGVTIQNCHITSGSVAAFYIKAADNAIVYNNEFIGQGGGVCFQIAIGDTGNTASGCTITYNRMTATETSDIFAWNTTGDGGNNENDYNKYRDVSSGDYGLVRGTNDIKTLTALQAAWTGYTNPNNDQNSSEV